MSDATTSAPAAAWGAVTKEQFCASRWRHVLPHDVDWRVPLTEASSYWIPVLSKLTRGDTVQVLTHDFTVAYELLVQDVSDLGGYFKFIARPLYPANLELPELIAPVGERYMMRAGKEINGHGQLFDVIDLLTGRAVRSNLPRVSAASAAHELNSVAKEAADQVALAAADDPRATAGALAGRAAELAELGRRGRGRARPDAA